MPNFFIDRPIFAWVIAIIIMLAGGLAILKLPVAQYPTIAPPAISIAATYPGADAKTVQDTVTQVIEQNMNGIDNLMYMSSNSDSTGTVQITLTFESGTDADIADGCRRYQHQWHHDAGGYFRLRGCQHEGRHQPYFRRG